MKKLVTLLLVLFISGCEFTSEIPLSELAPEVSNEETSLQEENVNTEDEVTVDEDTEESEFIDTLDLLEKVDVLDHWQQVVSEYTSYVDFRYQGCVSQTSLDPIECRKYDWQFRNIAYYHNNLYFKDSSSMLVRQYASDAMKRDQEYLQVIFLGELIGLIPASQRMMIERVDITDQFSITVQDGVLTLPNRYDLEYNVSFLRDLYSRWMGTRILEAITYDELEDILIEPVSEYASLGSDETKVYETYLAYYFQTISSGKLSFFDELTYESLHTFFAAKAFDASLEGSGEPLDPNSLPAHAVLYVNSELEKTLPASSPSALEAIDYVGITEQQMKDRRNNEDSVDNKRYPYRTYEITYIDDDSMMMYVNDDIAPAAADNLVEEVSQIYGQLPVFLRRPLNFVTVQPGTPNISLYPDGYVFHLDYYRMSGRPMHHFLVHEIAHISMDWAQGLNFPDRGRNNIYYKLDQSPLVESEWLDAYEKDGGFITQYAYDYPFPVPDNQFGYRGGEDVADTLVFYMASRFNSEQYHPKLLALWETVLGNRFAILDQLDFSLPPRGQLSQ